MAHAQDVDQLLTTRGFNQPSTLPWGDREWRWELPVRKGVVLRVEEDGDEYSLDVVDLDDDSDWVNLNNTEDLPTLLPLIDRLIAAFTPPPPAIPERPSDQTPEMATTP